MKIVLLDTNLLTKKMARVIEKKCSGLAQYKSYISTTLDDIVEHAYDADVILTNKAVLGREHFKLLPNLKYVIVIATGYDCVDVAAAAEFNIPVSNIPGYSAIIVAQHTIALLLELTNKVGKISDMVKHENKWLGTGHTHLELSGLTLGVVGFGDIAQRVINIALTLGMNILVYSRRTDYITLLPVEFVSKEELFKRSDVLSLHCPCTDETRQIINKTSLNLMKQTAYLINASRGGLVNEADLFQALSSGQIAGAALDVLNVEPATQDNQLFKLDNCIITPHNAWLSQSSLKRWLAILLDNINAYKWGKLINLV